MLQVECANSALIDDGAASGIRSIIPTEPAGSSPQTSTPAARAMGSAINDDPDGFLAANARRRPTSGGTTRAINDDPDGFLAANANADLSGGTAAETAFVDESEGYLTKVGYDANAATSAVTDAHDRGSLGSSAVTDAHDRGSVTRVDDDADGAGSQRRLRERTEHQLLVLPRGGRRTSGPGGPLVHF